MKVEFDWVVFDLGAVLIDWNPRYLYRRISNDETKIETFLREVATGDWNSQMDAGYLFQNAIDERAREFPEWKVWLQHWRDDWPTMLKGPIGGSVEIFSDVVARRKAGKLRGVVALSNWEANTFRIAKARFPFLGDFDGRLISGEEKLIKPDPRFFQLLSTRFGIDPKRAIFIDDVEKNTKVAQELGFHTHLFREPAALRDELRSLGILEG